MRARILALLPALALLVAFRAGDAASALKGPSVGAGAAASPASNEASGATLTPSGARSWSGAGTVGVGATSVVAPHPPNPRPPP